MTSVGLPGKSDRAEQVIWNPVGPDFFETYQIPIMIGRGLNDRDSAAGRKVVVVNEAFAQKYFGAESPIGRHLELEGDREIVGVVRDAKLVVPDLREPTSPMAFVP